MAIHESERYGSSIDNGIKISPGYTYYVNLDMMNVSLHIETRWFQHKSTYDIKREWTDPVSAQFWGVKVSFSRNPNFSFIYQTFTKVSVHII